MLGWLAMASACTNQGDPAAAIDKKAAWAAKAFPAPIIAQQDVRQAPSDYLLVDTRTEEEFAVSHLPGAINWPDYKRGDLSSAVRDDAAEGKPIVFYCSIGYRSGEATVRAAKLLGPDARVFNLYGGIFQWANEGGELEGGDRVHGYDADWGRLLAPEKRAPLSSVEGDTTP